MKYLLLLFLFLPTQLFALSCIHDPDWKPDQVVRGTVTEVKNESEELGFSKVFYSVIPDGKTTPITIAESLWYSQSKVKAGNKYEFKAYKGEKDILTIGPCKGSIEPIK
jgi:hypothetical protein